MAVDRSEFSRQDESRDLWRLPDILEVQVRRRRLGEPRRVTTGGVERTVQDVIEVEVRLSEPFTIRALGPVLWVGDQPLTVAEADSDTVYRFFAFEPQALQPGAPMALAWNSARAPRKETRFRYEPPETYRERSQGASG